MENFKTAILSFVDFHSKDFLLALARCLDGQRRRVRVLGSDRRLAGIPDQITRRFGTAVTIRGGDGAESNIDDESDITLLLESDPSRLSALLHRFIDRPAVLFAPRTERYLCGQGLFVVTIPKSGSHLLFHLLNEFRLHAGGVFQNAPERHTWYFPLGRDSHVPASTFFREMGQLDRGGFDHPLFTTPVIFMYRNPLDVLVSEATYLGGSGNGAANYYFQTLDDSTRLGELIDSPLLDEFYKRMAAFAPWLNLPNVIPVCFEELVGPKGGGSLDAQLREIWSLQLKLHIPGVPTFFAEVAFFTGTPTFNKGEISRHKHVLQPHHLDKLASFPQDFMRRFGYDMHDECGPGYLPRHVDRFRSRALEFPVLVTIPGMQTGSTPGVEAHPADLRVFTCRGYLIAQYGGRYYGVPRRLAPFNPELERAIPHLHAAYSLEELVAHLDSDPLESAEELTLLENEGPARVFDWSVPELVLEGYKGFNIVRCGDRFDVDAQARAITGSPVFFDRGVDSISFSSLVQAKAAIDSWGGRYCDAIPYLLKEDVNGRNVVLFRGRYLCVPCGIVLDRSDYSAIIDEGRRDCTVSDTMADSLDCAMRITADVERDPSI